MKKRQEQQEITVENYRKIVSEADRNIYRTRYVVDYEKLERFLEKAGVTKAKMSTLIGRGGGYLHALSGNDKKGPSMLGSEILENIVTVLNRMLPGENLKPEDFVLEEHPCAVSYGRRRIIAINNSLRDAGFVNPNGKVMTEKDVISYESRKRECGAVEEKESAVSAGPPELPEAWAEAFGKTETASEETENTEPVPVETNHGNDGSRQIPETGNEPSGGISDNSKEIVPALKNLLSALGMTIEEYAERSGFNETDRDLITRYDLITNRNADILRGRLLP